MTVKCQTSKPKTSIASQDSTDITAVEGLCDPIAGSKQVQNNLCILQHALSSSVNGIGITDLHGELLYANDAVVRMWGYDTKEELLGRSLPEFWMGDKVRQTMSTLGQTGVCVGEDIGRRRDGTAFHVQFSASIVEEEGGNPLYMFGSFVDISERKQAEEELRQSNIDLKRKVSQRTAKLTDANRLLRKEVAERQRVASAIEGSEADYRGLFESAHDAILVFDPATEIVLKVNQRACDVYGFDCSEFVGMSLASISKDNPRGKRHIVRTLDKGFFHHFETTQYRKDGTEMNLEVNASTVTFNGQPAILTINRDITESRLAQNALRDAHELAKVRNLALEQKNVALNEVLSHIEDEKRAIERQVHTNVEKIVMPTLESLGNKLGPTHNEYVQLLRGCLEELTSAFTHRIETNFARLSPRELQICNMVRNGLTSKEQADLLNSSEETIRHQRKSIRRKLGISKQKINLSSFLTSMDAE